ncbi:MAG: hypothetical protein KA257_06765 [Opitutaceae bacterium]|nr:hypothetical protein [Opitutaceae bacterium]
MLRKKIVHTALTQLETSAHERGRLKSRAEWLAYAQRIQRRFAAVVNHPDLQLQSTWRERPRSRRTFDGFSIENLLVESLPGSWMNVTVWKPDPQRWAPPWPAVVTPIGHNGKYSPNEQYPPQVFAANGYLSVSFDPPGFGEKARGNNHFEDGVRGYVVGHNPLAFFLADARRAIDYVLSRPDVNGADGVAMTGVSGGGFSTIGSAVLDQRLAVIGPSCFGLSDAVHPIRNGYAACPETLWFDRFADGLGLEDLLIGARFTPMLVMGGRDDSVMPAAKMQDMMRPVRTAYAGVGQGARLKFFTDACGHAYSPAQACAFVDWMRRWWRASPSRQPAEMPHKLQLVPEKDLCGEPPFGFCMATAAARAAKARQPATGVTAVRRGLARLIPGLAAHRRRGLQRKATPGSEMQLWVHNFQELSLHDGPDWELPATMLRPPKHEAGVLIFFDDRGRWTALHQWGWLNRAAGAFSHEGNPYAVLTVDLPGWGDTRPTPSPYDTVGWGGVDRWTGYVSAATGESVMALRLREAVRVVDFVHRQWKVPADRITLGGYGVGANVAGLAACLHGGLGGALLFDPLAEFASLATAPKSIWPHDAYFPRILTVTDLPEALALGRTPALVVGPRDAAGRSLGKKARRLFRGRHVKVLPELFSPASETVVLDWLRAKT